MIVLTLVSRLIRHLPITVALGEVGAPAGGIARSYASHAADLTENRDRFSPKARSASPKAILIDVWQEVAA